MIVSSERLSFLARTSALAVLALLLPAGSAFAQSWLSPGWQYRTKVVVNPSLISGGGHAGFPVLLLLDGSNASVFAHAKADGSDLVVTREDGVTPLPREIVSWSPGDPSAEVWFRDDLLSAASNEVFLYYGNPDTTLAPLGGGVWDTSYLGVYHFAENPGLGVLWDYGPGGHHGLAGAGSAWSAGDVIEGAIGQGWRFNGTTNWIDGDAIASSDSSFTIGAWFACWNHLQDANFAFSTGPWHLSAKRNESQRYPDYASSTSYFRWNPILPDTLLHQFVWAMDGVNDTIRFYFDGVEQDYNVRWVSAASKPPDKVYQGLPITGNVGLASNYFGNQFDNLEGIADEFRVFEGVRSPGWVTTEYNNQGQTGLFLTYGQEESRQVGVADLEPGGARRLLRAQPNPFRRSTMIQFELSRREQVMAKVYGLDGRLVRTLYDGDLGPGAARVPWDGREDGGAPVSNGVYFLRVVAGDETFSGRVVLLR
jgi:hypothetical protein